MMTGPTFFFSRTEFRWFVGLVVGLSISFVSGFSIVPSRAQTLQQSVAYADSFDTNTLDRYEVKGGVEWREDKKHIHLIGNNESALYSHASFGNQVLVSGEVYIPSADPHQYGSVALALRDQQPADLYWATLA